MIHLIYSDHPFSMEEIFSDIPKDQEFLRVDNFADLLKEERKFDGHIFIILNAIHPHEDYESLRDKFSLQKIILLSKHISDVELHDLQINRSFFDLFYRLPISFTMVLKAIKMVSTFVAGSWLKTMEDNSDANPVSEALAPEPSVAPEAPVDLSSLLDINQDDLNIAAPKETEEPINDSAASLALPDVESEIDLAASMTAETSLADLDAPIALDAESIKNEPLKNELLNNEPLNLEVADLSMAQNLIMDSAINDVDLESAPENTADQNLENKFVMEHEPPIDLATHAASSIDLDLTQIEVPARPQEMMPETDASLGSASEDQLMTASLIENSATATPPHPVTPMNIAPMHLQEVIARKEEQVFRLLGQNEQMKEERKEQEDLIRQLQLENHEMKKQLADKCKYDDDADFKIQMLKTTLERERDELKIQNKILLDKTMLLEKRVHDLMKGTGKNDSANSVDIRKFKAREQELEEKISLLQSDTAAQVQHREKKIVELKRKIDLLEFDLKDSTDREKESKLLIKNLENSLMTLKKSLIGLVDQTPMQESLGDHLSKNKVGNYDI